MGQLVSTGSSQGPILHSHDQEAQDRVCPLGLTPIVSSHASNLWAISYWVQDGKVTAICLNGAGGAFKGGLLQGLHSHCGDSVVCAQSLWHAAGPRHPQQGILIDVSILSPVVQLEIIVGKAGHPSITHGI